MAKQLCFPGCKPKRPTIRSWAVAERIARRLVAVVNPDEFHWSNEEIGDRIADVTAEIMRMGRPATVFARLWKRGGCVMDPYGWEGIDEDCRQVADDIEADELQRAVRQYERDYA